MQPSKKRKVPLRTCTGCGETKGKKELIRIVNNKDGIISIDLQGKLPGRGAYICHNPECLKKMRKAKRLERSFERSIPDEVYDSLEKELENDG